MKTKTTLTLARRYRALRVTYHGPTDTKGSRISITDCRSRDTGTPAPKVTLPYDHALNNTADMALAWLGKCGWKIEALTLDVNGDWLLLTRGFSHSLKD